MIAYNGNGYRSFAKLSRLTIAAVVIALTTTVVAQEELPRESVIDMPAIGDGLCVNNVFQSNMVLQRDKPIVVWGWAAPDETVVVSFDGKEQHATAAKDRSWKVTFGPMPANATPKAMTVKGAKKTLTFENVLVGDVWILGGQSNMEFPISRIEDGALEIATANYPEIRLLTVPYAEGPDQQTSFASLMEWSGWFKTHFRKGYWDVCTPESIPEFSGIGTVFARRIHMGSKIPIGVIDVSRGGTTVETWTPEAVLRKSGSELVKSMVADWDTKVADWDSKKDLEERVKRHQEWMARMKAEGKTIPENRKEPTDLRPGPGTDKNRPGSCYAGMIAPIAGLAVKGAIFHQGYNNCNEGSRGATRYYHIFPEMIKAWRTAFNDPKMPFGIISLCTAGTPQTRENYTQSMLDAGPYIREAQYKTYLDLCKAGDTTVGFVSTYYLRRRWYHPQLKIPAGDMVARWALATQYGFGENLLWKPPMIVGMSVKDGTIILELDSTVGNSLDGELEGFAIAGKDRKFHPATAKAFVKGKNRRGRPDLDRKKVILSSPMVSEPIHFRYAWARNPMGNVEITQGRQPPFTGVVLATQRSDDWDMADVPLGVLGAEVTQPLTRAQGKQISDALKELDVQRRLKEARSYIERHEAKAKATQE